MKHLLIVICSIALLLSCQDNDSTFPNVTLPDVNNLTASNITSFSAELTAEVYSMRDVDLCGFLYSESDTKPESLNWGTEVLATRTYCDFTKSISGLKEGTTYYYVAFLTDYNGNYTLSDVKSFCTMGNEVPPVVVLDPINLSLANNYVSFTIQFQVNNASACQEAGFILESSNHRFKADGFIGNWIYSQPISYRTYENSVSESVTAYAIMNDGTTYIGNKKSFTVYLDNVDPGTDPGTDPEQGKETNKRADYTYARTYYTGGHNGYSSYRSVVDYLNNNKLLIYKDSNAKYYWKDLNGIKHYVRPDISYNDQIYASDYMANTEYPYNIMKAYIYVSFRFCEF